VQWTKHLPNHNFCWNCTAKPLLNLRVLEHYSSIHCVQMAAPVRLPRRLATKKPNIDNKRHELPQTKAVIMIKLLQISTRIV
jgi:hypothetical protein